MKSSYAPRFLMILLLGGEVTAVNRKFLEVLHYLG